MKISIIMPAFNEVDTIESVLNELESYMKNYTGETDWEIIVVNDGSSDNTMDILNNLKKSREWLKVVDLVFNCGRGKALRAGLAEAAGDTIVSLDADLSYAPYHIERLVDKMEKENADIVLASAYGKGGTVRNVPANRLLISRLGNKVLSYMFGGNISVLTCLARAYKREFMQRLDLHSEDKDVHLEILYKARMLGGKIIEVPADLYWREDKLSKIESGQKRRRSTLKFKKTSYSHIFFALLNKPGIIFRVPGYILMLVFFYVTMIIFSVVIKDINSGTSIYMAIRNNMISAAPSWFTAAVSFVLSIQFFTLGFLTFQNKRNYEETYKTLNTILTEQRKKKT
jgi:glycosyltransferase involved in cell wall biosynthesis